MGPIYRLLGIAAGLGQRLSRISFNFVQLNWAAMIALGALVAIGTKQVRDAMNNGTAARAATIDEVLQHRDVEHNYMTVSGRLLPIAVFRKTKTSRGGSNRVEASFLPLLGDAGQRALLVKRPGDHVDGGGPQPTQLTGMLVPLDSVIRDKLQQRAGRVDQLALDLDYMLEEGAAPGSAGVWIAVTAAAAALLLAMLVTWQRRYLVFRPDHAPAPSGTGPAADDAGIDLRVSGRFRLDMQTARRFLSMPAGVARLDSGELALVSNIDASSRFFGITTVARRGVWAILLAPRDLQTLESGHQYFGLQRRPALRVGHRDADGRQETAVLACADDGERERLWRELQRLAAD